MQGLGAALKRLAAGDLSQELADGFSADYASVATISTWRSPSSRMRCSRWSPAPTRSGSGPTRWRAPRTTFRIAPKRRPPLFEATTASLAQISKAVRSSADAASHARTVVAAADEAARTNSAVVSDATSAMDAISKSHADISQIIGVIDEIAFQTSLLALNAGVEAARAGEAGKGFAVVASEVRALALRSAEAAKEIKTLIGSSGAQVATGVKLVGETGAALAHIFDEVSRINEIVNEIATGANQQTMTLDTVSERGGQDGRGDAAERRDGRTIERSDPVPFARSRAPCRARRAVFGRAQSRLACPRDRSPRQPRQGGAESAPRPKARSPHRRRRRGPGLGGILGVQRPRPGSESAWLAKSNPGANPKLAFCRWFPNCGLRSHSRKSSVALRSLFELGLARSGRRD